ncbi:DUF4169 family protein [Asticcacaulis sp. AC402]|uniref:DUF4169 family protein n=1 Tax=Asticcacaulis sp. AC402 TaxID=1282361 RepID=UPI0003C3C76F|nr:DUF4169 family protein [Asticcacaulis sp. AC402]ESQ75113.1 hypothetical protein ABAC402_10620 [Asticcacaulis sp. AC402]
MTDIINFNKARKAKLKQSKAKNAAENRVRFGVSGKARAADRLNRDQQTARLDGHRLATTVENQKSVDEEQ